MVKWKYRPYQRGLIAKSNDHPTPPALSSWIYHTVAPFHRHTKPVVLDPACGNGALLSPWASGGWHTHGVDIKQPATRHVIHDFWKFDFCDTKIFAVYDHQPSVVVCNPPFTNSPVVDGVKMMYPEVFARVIFHRYGDTVPLVMIVPAGFRHNVSCSSRRYNWLANEAPPITTIVSLPVDTFNGVQFHSEIVMFNIHGLPPHMTLPRHILVHLIPEQKRAAYLEKSNAGNHPAAC